MEKRHDDLQETAKAQAAFIQYQALGPDRSLTKLCQLLGKPPGYIRALERWSSSFNWQERVKAHDVEILQAQADAQEQKRLEAEEERRRKLAEEIENMHKRHALIGTTQQARALTVLEKLAGVDEISAATAVNLLRLAVDMERAARGENQQRLEISGPDGGAIQITTEWGTFKPVEDKK